MISDIETIISKFKAGEMIILIDDSAFKGIEKSPKNDIS